MSDAISEHEAIAEHEAMSPSVVAIDATSPRKRKLIGPTSEDADVNELQSQTVKKVYDNPKKEEFFQKLFISEVDQYKPVDIATRVQKHIDNAFRTEDRERNKERLQAALALEQQTREFEALQAAENFAFQQRKVLFHTLNPDIVYNGDMYPGNHSHVTGYDINAYIKYFFEHKAPANGVYKYSTGKTWYQWTHLKDLLRDSDLRSYANYCDCAMDEAIDNYTTKSMEPPEEPWDY